MRVLFVEKAPFSVFGGPHPTFFPDMIEEPGVDGICIGEGEGPIADLANTLNGNGHRPRPRPDIPNWWFKLDGEIVRNPVRPLIHDLGSLPHSDRHLVYDKHDASRRTPIKHFMASRGCPYACTYCFNHAYYQIYKREKRGNQRPAGCHLLVGAQAPQRLRHQPARTSHQDEPKGAVEHGAVVLGDTIVA